MSDTTLHLFSNPSEASLKMSSHFIKFLIDQWLEFQVKRLLKLKHHSELSTHGWATDRVLKKLPDPTNFFWPSNFYVRNYEKKTCKNFDPKI